MDGPLWAFPTRIREEVEGALAPLGFTVVTRRGESEEGVEEVVPAAEVPIGIFTMVFGDGERRTIRVRDRGFQDGDGNRIVSFLSGRNNEAAMDYTGFAHLDRMGELHVWRRFRGNESSRVVAAINWLLAADAEERHAMGVAYARESGNCYICNRTLTTPESIEAGIGPICAGRL